MTTHADKLDRFKKDMWEKIAKEMALPWRAAEAMHWQIGEVEMASRANVPVFHLAGYSPSQPTQSYINHLPMTTPQTGSGRSEESASPRSATEGYLGTNHLIDPAVGARSEVQIRPGQRRNSDISSVNEHEDLAQARRSPRPLTGHDSVASSAVGDREGSTVPKQYLSPFAKVEDGEARR